MVVLRQKDVMVSKKPAQFERANYEQLDNEAVDKHVLRSSGVLDYKTNCIFCSCADPYDGKKSEFRLISARTLELRNTILQA